MKDKYDFLKFARERYSLRAFSEKKVEAADLEAVLEAGRLAPTAHNDQPQRILVIQSEENLAKLKKCTMSHYNAPAALLVCADKTACWKRAYDGKLSADIDASIVATQMMLQAQSLGLGTTWVMHFDPVAMREEFAVPDNYEMTALLVLGYPAEGAQPSARHTERKPLGETVFYDEF
ncbi:MAG: nitroreductase [Eubacteriaceae bacterium]|nr:nitroreductase [Eubacteriaceae bacterium]